MQVWEPGIRTWKELKRGIDGKYTLGKKQQTIHVATPWIGGNNLTKRKLVTGIPDNFRALQRYLAAAPGMSNDAFETTIGYEKSEHGDNYVKDQVSDNVVDLANAKVKPFTLPMFFSLTVGENVGAQLQDRILQQVW